MASHDPDSDSIPLVCHICPKKPSFSDTSHLLTHIASKGHLSNYFRAQVKGRQHAETQFLVNEYDDWFTRHKVQDLLSARMEQKEKRNRATQPPKEPRPAPKLSTQLAQAPRLTLDYQRTSLDPRLQYESDSIYSRSQIPSQPSANTDHYIVSNALHDHGHEIREWRKLCVTQQDTAADHNVKQEREEYDDYDDRSAILYESSQRTHFCKGTASRLKAIPLASPNGEHMLTETISDSSKMKGAYWEGMACFDSATPEMKRKRNQKKSYSVAQHLQASSEIIQPVELVFDDVLAHRRSRLITGEPFDPRSVEESPLKGESTPEPDNHVKKRRCARRSRQPLAELDPNVKTAKSYVYSQQKPSSLPTRTRSVRNSDPKSNANFHLKTRAKFSVLRDPESTRVPLAQSATDNILQADKCASSPDFLAHEFSHASVLADPSSGSSLCFSRAAPMQRAPYFPCFRSVGNGRLPPNFSYPSSLGQISFLSQPVFQFGSNPLPSMGRPLNDFHSYNLALPRTSSMHNSNLFIRTPPMPLETAHNSTMCPSTLSLNDIGRLTHQGDGNDIQTIAATLKSGPEHCGTGEETISAPASDCSASI